MAHPFEFKAKAYVVWLCRFFLAVCFFCACHRLLHAQDALKPADFKQYGNWDLTGKSFLPLLGSPEDLNVGGNLHYLKRLPENFEIFFRWTEMGKINAEAFAGGLQFSFDDPYQTKSHCGAYGRKISCVCSGFSLNFHTKDPTLPAKITLSNRGDMVESKPFNFLRPPGKENQARLACFGDTVQVIVNDHLVYQFNMQTLITEYVEPNLHAGLGEHLKIWNDARKRGLFLSVGVAGSKEEADSSVINGISIRDFGKSTDNGLSPLVDPKTSRQADWCRNDRWNFTDDKIYKDVYDFLITKKCQFPRPGLGAIFPKFDGMTNPGGTNNPILIQPFLTEGFAQDTPANKSLLSIFKAYLNDLFQSCVTILRFKNEGLAKRFFDESIIGYEDMISCGEIFFHRTGTYVMVIYRNDKNAKKDDFLAFCKKAAESMK